MWASLDYTNFHEMCDELNFEFFVTLNFVHV